MEIVRVDETSAPFGEAEETSSSVSMLLRVDLIFVSSS